MGIFIFIFSFLWIKMNSVSICLLLIGVAAGQEATGTGTEGYEAYDWIEWYMREFCVKYVPEQCLPEYRTYYEDYFISRLESPCYNCGSTAMKRSLEVPLGRRTVLPLRTPQSTFSTSRMEKCLELTLKEISLLSRHHLRSTSFGLTKLLATVSLSPIRIQTTLKLKLIFTTTLLSRPS